MGSRLDRVMAWLHDLRRVDLAATAPHLSHAGAEAALTAALDAIPRDALVAAVDRPGTPFPHAVMVVARTVFTAPIEWSAVLLGRGTALTLKPAATDRGFVEAMVDLAAANDLPLTSTLDREVVGRAPLVVAMGSDATVAAIETQVARDACLLGFGHRFGAAFLTQASSFRALGPDLALHDGLGCMSAAAVFTTLPEDEARAAMRDAWTTIDARLPAGPPDPGAAAMVRQREALARVLGTVDRTPGWSVHQLPLDRFRPAALPRSTALHLVADRTEVEVVLEGHRDALSTFATDDPDLHVPAGRRCAPGHMQRPPLARLHDGVDWLARTMQQE